MNDPVVVEGAILELRVDYVATDVPDVLAPELLVCVDVYAVWRTNPPVPVEDIEALFGPRPKFSGSADLVAPGLRVGQRIVLLARPFQRGPGREWWLDAIDVERRFHPHVIPRAPRRVAVRPREVVRRHTTHE